MARRADPVGIAHAQRAGSVSRIIAFWRRLHAEDRDLLEATFPALADVLSELDQADATVAYLSGHPNHAPTND